MTGNFVDQDQLANDDVSSEQTAFPVANAYNKQRRSKVWRSNGYFKVISGENTIIFRDAVAGNKTATVAAGSYSSTATFMAAVDAAFEAAGVANYTVTQNGNLKFVIASDLSGGATAFRIIWTDAGSADMAALLGYDTSADDTGASSYTADVLKINSEEWILWDMGISSMPNAFMFTGPRNRAIKISPSAVIKIEGNHTNNFASPAYSETLTYDDEVIALIREGGLDTVAYRYWRVQFIDQNPLGYIEVGAFFLGQYYSPIRGKVQFPFHSEFVDRSNTIFSEGGQTFTDIFEQSQRYTITWFALTKEEVEEITEIFANYGLASPFFVSFDTNVAFSSVLNRRLKFVKFEDEPQYELVAPNIFTMTMKFREEL
jgi:hypothetical protein